MSIQYKPHAYQKKAIKFLLEHAEAALFLDPGLGKTSITYAALKVLKNKGAFKGALVLAPLRPAYSVWPKEQEKWTEFSGFSVGILHGDKKEYVLEEDHDLYVMNYEGIDWLFGKPEPDWKRMKDPKEKARKQEQWKKDTAAAKARLKKLLPRVDVLVVDELSKFKHTDSGRFKAIKPYLPKFARRWGLTGSPASNGLMNLFGQCYVLDLGRALGKFITHYRNKYFYPTGYGGYTWELQEGADKKIYDAVRPLALRMDAEDYLEMPKVIPVPIKIELPPDARKAYDKMEEEMFAEIGDELFLAATGSAASIKCEQIANGALYKNNVDPLTGLPISGKREWSAVHSAKLEALEDLLEELQGTPLLGAYWFGHDLERILKHIGKDTPHMDVSAKEADRLVTRWNAGNLDFLLGHPASMGHGLNMQEGNAQHVAFFHIPWDFELYDQLIRRLRRQGNKAKQVFVYHIIARDTIDEVKIATLGGKDSTQRNFFNALKSYKASRVR